MSYPSLQQELIWGVDFDHEGIIAPDIIRDVNNNYQNEDYNWLNGIMILQQELYRLFNLTPKGSFVDDPTYGMDWSWIGTPLLDIQVTLGLVQSAVYEALTHPSFREKFSVQACRAFWLPNTQTTVYVLAELRLFGLEENWASIYEFPVDGVG